MQVVRNQGKTFRFQQREGFLLHGRKWRFGRNRRIDEQREHLAGGPEIGGNLAQRLLHCQLCRRFGLLLILIDQVDEGLDQVVVDLAKAIIGETQQVQPYRPRIHALQLVDRVELDQRGIIFPAVHGDVRLGKEGLGKVMHGLKKLAALDLPT
jgi:hypothetical protein